MDEHDDSDDSVAKLSHGGLAGGSRSLATVSEDGSAILAVDSTGIIGSQKGDVMAKVTLRRLFLLACLSMCSSPRATH